MSFCAAIDLGTTYSGYAFLSKDNYNKDPSTITTNVWYGSNLMSLKAPTAILLDTNRRFVAFGYEAEDKYSELAADEQKQYYYFHRFKMGFNEMKFTRTVNIKDETGKEMEAFIVFQHALQFLTNHLYKNVSDYSYERTSAYYDSKRETDMYFVLTVPAIWDNSAKQFFREASIKAGIPSEQLTIVTEAEAAVHYCHSLTPLKPDMKYMVVDLGGAAADITVHYQSEDGTFKEVFPASSAPFGGIYVEKAFYNFLMEIFGENVMNKFKQTELEDFMYLFRQFEAKKNAIQVGDSHSVVIKLPLALITLVESRKGEIKTALEQSPYGQTVSYIKQKLRFSHETFMNLFMSTIDPLIKHIERLFREDKLSDVENLIMVGGLSECGLIQHKIVQKFGDNKKIIIPDTASLAVLKGAVLYGHEFKATQLIRELKDLGLETVNDFKDIMKLGSYKCFWNRIYLVGSYNIGKTTLAKLLVGDPVPEYRESTDGIWLYIGRAGMSLDDNNETYSWVFLPEGTSMNTVVTSMLMAMNEKTDISTHDPSASVVVKNVVESIDPKNVVPERSVSNEEAGKDKTTPVQNDLENKIKTAKKLDIRIPLSYWNQNILKSSVQIVAGLKEEDVHKLIIEMVKKGDYKMKIIPFDLWDFGGQKDYYMTHQLFITSRGVYVVMFNGSIDIHKYLPELGYLPGQYGKPTTAVYLKHWVNSILTYCKRKKTGFPKILFVATHKDLLHTNDVEKKRNQHLSDITALFESHVGRKHIQYESLIFVNAKDQNDPEVEILKQELMKCAVENPRWGEPMPTAWVPLELELMRQVEKGVNILTMEQLEGLNSENQTMTLNPKQLETFLKIQHSLGKIIYFDDVHLKNCVIINPVFLIEVLRSIVTHQQFWPKGENFQKVLDSLHSTGLLTKQDLFDIWAQPQFQQILSFKEYMLNMLKNLDIIIEQNKDLEQGDLQEETFIVPCMISMSNNTDFLARWLHAKYSIHLAYRFCDAVIPPALVYRFIGSFLTMWALKVYRSTTMLFTDLAVVEVDKLHNLAVQVVDNAIIVSLLNLTDKGNIVPTIASSIQECLTTNLQRITEFYSSVSDDQTSSNFDDKQNPFQIEFGVFCGKQNKICFFHHSCMPSGINATWTCKTHKVKHQVNDLKKWFADKVGPESCRENCTGIGLLLKKIKPSDQHLRRLADVLTMQECKELVLNLALPFNVWDKLHYQFRDPNDINFMALRRCKEKNVDFTLGKLNNALEKLSAQMTHKLCQSTTEHELQCGLPEDRLKEVPTDEILEEVSNHIGAASLALGVELGLEVPSLEVIQAEHKFKLKEQTRHILKMWKKLQQPQPTVLILVKALERIGKAACIETCID